MVDRLAERKTIEDVLASARQGMSGAARCSVARPASGSRRCSTSPPNAVRPPAGPSRGRRRRIRAAVRGPAPAPRPLPPRAARDPGRAAPYARRGARTGGGVTLDAVRGRTRGARPPLGLGGRFAVAALHRRRAHWLDAESLHALAFVGRRVHAEGIAILFAIRPDAGHGGLLDGIPTLELAGLPREFALELLGRLVEGAVDPQVADQIVDATGGNPLALRDLGTEWLSGDVISRGAPPADPARSPAGGALPGAGAGAAGGHPALVGARVGRSGR